MHQDLSTFLPQKSLNLGYTKFFYELKPKSKGKIKRVRAMRQALVPEFG